jgi:hypothetical protein
MFFALTMIISIALDASSKCIDGPSLSLYHVTPGQDEIACYITGSHTLYIPPGTYFKVRLHMGD